MEEHESPVVKFQSSHPAGQRYKTVTGKVADKYCIFSTDVARIKFLEPDSHLESVERTTGALTAGTELTKARSQNCLLSIVVFWKNLTLSVSWPLVIYNQ